MKRSEKQLMMLLALLFALVLMVRVVPLAVDFYHRGRADIAQQQDRIERYRTLIVDTAKWQQREQLKTAEVTDMQGWIFPGTDPNLVSSSMQRSVRLLMADNGVELREAGVARYSYVGKWLMVEQDLSFSTDQQKILPFLQAMGASHPRLQLSALTINRNRRQFTGNITVVGFSHAAGKEPVKDPGKDSSKEGGKP